MSTPERVVCDLRNEFDCSLLGWKCLEPRPLLLGPFEPTLLEFLRDGESIVSGDEMVKRAKEMSIDSGLRHAEAVIRNDPKVNKVFGNSILLFPEVWMGPGGACVWCLYPISGYWQLNYDELSHGFNSDYRLVSA